MNSMGAVKLRARQSCSVKSHVLAVFVIIYKNSLSKDATGIEGLGWHNQGYLSYPNEMWELFTTMNKTPSDQSGICNLKYTNPWSRGLGF